MRCEDEIAGCFAGDLLSQLSYTPMGKMYIIRHAAKCQEFFHAFRKSLKIILCGWV